MDLHDLCALWANPLRSFACCRVVSFPIFVFSLFNVVKKNSHKVFWFRLDFQFQPQRPMPCDVFLFHFDLSSPFHLFLSSHLLPSSSSVRFFPIHRLHERYVHPRKGSVICKTLSRVSRDFHPLHSVYTLNQARPSPSLHSVPSTFFRLSWPHFPGDFVATVESQVVEATPATEQLTRQQQQRPRLRS